MTITNEPWSIVVESHGTYVRNHTGGLVCTLNAGSQTIRDQHASLIQAIPDMIRALEELISEFEYKQGDTEVGWLYEQPDTFGIILARAALTKAGIKR